MSSNRYARNFLGKSPFRKNCSLNSAENESLSPTPCLYMLQNPLAQTSTLPNVILYHNTLSKIIPYSNTLPLTSPTTEKLPSTKQTRAPRQKPPDSSQLGRMTLLELGLLRGAISYLNLRRVIHPLLTWSAHLSTTNDINTSIRILELLGFRCKEQNRLVFCRIFLYQFLPSD